MRRIAPLLLALLAGACAAPAPPPRPAPAPAPPPPPAAAAPVEWRDLPENPGRWRYAAQGDGSRAEFVAADGAVALTLGCLRAARIVTIARAGAAAGPVLITTSYAGQSFMGEAAGVRLPANDKFLDMIAFSRGRFSVAAPGAALLVVPAWAEPARVVEDCRG